MNETVSAEFIGRRLDGLLCCFEKPNDPPNWCHRQLAADWLAKGLGIAVPEFGFETLTQDQHPLRAPERDLLVRRVIDFVVDLRIDSSAMTEMSRDRETCCRKEVRREAQR